VSRRPAAEEIAAWILLASLLMFVLLEHLVAAAVVALALYVILEGVTKRMSPRLSGSTARPLAVLFVTIITAAVVVGAIALIVTMVRHGATTIPDMMNQMAEILGSVRLWLRGGGPPLLEIDRVR